LTNDVVRDKPKGSTCRDDEAVDHVILQAALRIIDRDGVDGLSMRRLSDEVGRDPTVLYRHISNKAALLDGVAEIVLGQLCVDTADPDWAAQLRTVAQDFRRLALAHPNVVPLLVTRPLGTPLGRRPPGMSPDSTDEFGQCVIGGAKLLAVAMLEKDPLPDATIDPAEVQRVNWQSALVRLSRASQHSKRKSLRLSASCHAAKPRWPRLGPPSRAYRRASLSVIFQTSSSCFAEEIYQPSLTP
jgi:Bacterial regulatory proteins, tetR family